MEVVGFDEGSSVVGVDVVVGSTVGSIVGYSDGCAVVDCGVVTTVDSMDCSEVGSFVGSNVGDDVVVGASVMGVLDVGFDVEGVAVVGLDVVISA